MSWLRNIGTLHPFTGKPYGSKFGDPLGTVALGSYIKRNPTTAYNTGMALARGWAGDWYGAGYYGTQALRGRRGYVRRYNKYKYRTRWRKPSRRGYNLRRRGSYRKRRFMYKSKAASRLSRFHKTKQRYRKSRFNFR